MKDFEEINWETKLNVIKISRTFVLILWEQERAGHKVCGSDHGDFLIVFWVILHIWLGDKTSSFSHFPILHVNFLIPDVFSEGVLAGSENSQPAQQP